MNSITLLQPLRLKPSETLVSDLSTKNSALAVSSGNTEKRQSESAPARTNKLSGLASRWSESRTTLSRQLAMPAQLSKINLAPVLTATNLVTKSCLEKNWSVSQQKALSQSAPLGLIMLKHEMQLTLAEAVAPRTLVASQCSAKNLPVSPDCLEQAQAQTAKLEALSSPAAQEESELASSKEIDQYLQDSINEINEDYLSSYTNILSQFNAFFSDFADFKSLISQYVHAGEDGKIKVDGASLASAIDQLIKNYTNHPLYPEAGKTATQEEAQKWADEMGLPGSCVISDGAGYKVILDLLPLKTMRDSVNSTFSGENGIEVDSAQYQAWLAGFDMQADKYQNFMQVMTQKYTTANSVFDNLVKVLSSTITSMLESDKSFFNV